MTDREKLCKEFTDLTGGHWHGCRWDNTVKVYKCLECELTSGTPIQNNKYTNPADVLRVMMKRDDYDVFIREGLQKEKWLEIEEFIEIYIIEPDALLKVAVEFLKEASHD